MKPAFVVERTAEYGQQARASGERRMLYPAAKMLTITSSTRA
jgi:hypothetical protein